MRCWRKLVAQCKIHLKSILARLSLHSKLKDIYQCSQSMHVYTLLEFIYGFGMWSVQCLISYQINVFDTIFRSLKLCLLSVICTRLVGIIKGRNYTRLVYLCLCLKLFGFKETENMRKFFFWCWFSRQDRQCREISH